MTEKVKCHGYFIGYCADCKNNPYDQLDHFEKDINCMQKVMESMRNVLQLHDSNFMEIEEATNISSKPEYHKILRDKIEYLQQSCFDMANDISQLRIQLPRTF